MSVNMGDYYSNVNGTEDLNNSMAISEEMDDSFNPDCRLPLSTAKHIIFTMIYTIGALGNLTAFCYWLEVVLSISLIKMESTKISFTHSGPLPLHFISVWPSMTKRLPTPTLEQTASTSIPFYRLQVVLFMKKGLKHTEYWT